MQCPFPQPSAAGPVPHCGLQSMRVHDSVASLSLPESECGLQKQAGGSSSALCALPAEPGVVLTTSHFNAALRQVGMVVLLLSGRFQARPAVRSFILQF